MDIKTLESFRLSDAVKFHDNLNPKLWSNNKLRPEVKKQLKIIAEDFLEELGVSGLDVVDITVSGSNAAYSYTPHSDLDLHIIVDMSQLSNDEVYKELFQAKKTLYNDSHSIKVHEVPVELYVQDSKDPVISLGEYSLLNDKWLKFPAKRRANFDQTATKSKYNKLLDLIKFALNSKNIKKVNLILKKIKQYRQAGLDKAGEFGPENIAYKALRSQGYITKLYSLRDQLHSKDLSIETMYAQEDYHPNAKPRGPEFKPTMPKGTVRVDVSDVYDWYKLGQHISNMKGLGKHDFGQGPPSTIMAFGDEDLEHQYIQALKKTGLSTTDIDPASHKKIKGQKVDPTYNVNEAKTSIRSQIINAVQQNGPGEYFVRFTDSDKLGFSQKQMFGKTPDVGDDVFDVDNIGQNVGRRVLWFYPLNYYLKNYNDVYASEQPYVWLVKLKPNAWLQKVKRGDTKKLPAPNGKERVGILRMSDPPAALFFSHGYDIVGKYYDYAKQHKTHGQVQGKPKPSFFDRVRGIDETLNTKPGKKNDAYWEHDSIKLAQNAAQKHAEKHFKQGVAEGTEPDYMAGHCHVMALALKKLHPDWKIRAHIGWDEDAEDDSDYRIDHVYIVAPDGSAYDCRGKFSNEQELVGPDETGGVETQFVDYGIDDIKHDIARGELKRFSKEDLTRAVKFIQSKQGVAEAFDQPYKLKWEKGDHGDVDAYTQLPDGNYLSIMFNKEKNDEGEEAWSVEFYRNNSQEVTGEGDAQRIFATVLGAIQTFIKKYKPNRIVFSASKEVEQGQNAQSRAKLYDSLVQRYARTWGYKAFRADTGNKVIYELNRIAKQVAEASGYVPSESEKNDPRFKTALTVDVKPDSIKKNAKAFSSKVSRAGIPPTLKPSGKF